MKDGQTIIEKGYGYANYAQNIHNAPETIYSIASVSKPITAVAIMQFVERGVLSLEDSITQYLPATHGAHIKIKHLFSLTSGLKDYVTLSQFDVVAVFDPMEVFNAFKDWELSFEPGKRYEYINTNYFLLGMLIEKLSGQTYGQYLQDHIFAPAGMNNSGHVNDYYRDLVNQAIGYDSLDTYTYSPFILNHSVMFSAGGVHSTVQDLYKFDQALQQNILLQESTKLMMYQENLGGYGYGWTLLKNGKFVVHSGDSSGFKTAFYRDMEHAVTVVLLCNESMNGPIPVMNLANDIYLFIELD